MVEQQGTLFGLPTLCVFQRTKEQSKHVCLIGQPSTYLGWCTASLNIDPEASYIDEQSNQSNGKEFNLQMSSQYLEQQLNLRLYQGASQCELSECLPLLLLLATGNCEAISQKKSVEVLLYTQQKKINTKYITHHKANKNNNNEFNEFDRLGGWCLLV